MVILFSDRKNKCEREIIEILTGIGANYISDKFIYDGSENITLISVYKSIELNMSKGIVVILDDTERFSKQTFPKGIIGICEDCNKKALSLFSKENIQVISCGINAKNTVTFSSINENSLVVAIQRTITDYNYKEIEPTEYTIKLKRKYNELSIMVSVTILLLSGIIPKEI